MAKFIARSKALQKKLPRREPDPGIEINVREIEVPTQDPVVQHERASKFGPKGKQRFTILGVSVSPEEKKVLRAALKSRGVRNLSEWAREVLFQAAGIPIPSRRER